MTSGRTSKRQQAAAPKRERRSISVFGKRPGEIGGTAGGNGRKAGSLQRTADRQQRAGLAGIRARIGGQFNGWLSTMPVTAGLCGVYCVRTASVWRRTEGAKRRLLEAGRSDGRQRVGGNSGRPDDCFGLERASRCGQFGKGNSGAGGFSVVRLRGEAFGRPGCFRYGSLYGKGGGVAEKRWGSRRKGEDSSHTSPTAAKALECVDNALECVRTD